MSIIKNKNILNVIKTIMTYLGILCLYNFDEAINYSFIFLLFIILIIYFFYQTDKISFSIKDNKYATIGSILLGTILVFGKMTYDVIEINNATFITLFNVFYCLLKISLLYPFLKRLLCLIFKYFPKINILTNRQKYSKKIFLIFFLIIFIGYLPYLFRYYPGKMTYDTTVQLSFIKNNILSDIHPLVHTEFLGLFVRLGINVFHNENLGIMFYTLTQMLILSLTYAFVCYYLYKNNVKLSIVFIVVLCYAILPLYTHYAVTIWKDILFATSFIYLTIFLRELKINKKLINYLGLSLGLIILLFMRNNGMYIYLFMLPFLLIFFKKDYKGIINVISILLIYLIIRYPLYDYLGVKKSVGAEYLAIPTSQISRVITKNGNISSKEYDFLNTLTNTSNIPNLYTPYIVDPVKNTFDNSLLDKNVVPFLKLWSKLFLKNSGTYIEAYLSQTLGYWYPGVNYWSTITPTNNNLKINKLIDITASHKIPFSGIIWNIGLGFLITLLSFSLCLYQKKKNYILYGSFLGLWITMMLASPVFAEFRYVYGLFTSMPIILLLPFLKSKN